MQRSFYARLIVWALMLVIAETSIADNDNQQSRTPVSKTPKITISKETTCLTGPTRADGTLDCAAALNRITGRDVTPQNNAAVLLWQALGPKSIPKDQRDKYFRMLGVEPLSEDGKYFVDITTVCEREQPNKNSDLSDPSNMQFFEALMDQKDRASRRPWSKAEFPLIARWLDENREPLLKIVAGSRRERYCSPLRSRGDDENEELTAPGNLDFNRSLANLLLIRSNLRLQEGEIEEARQDLLA
jgi:hypothetical protein